MLSFTTSRMEAITKPSRWGYEIVDVFFGTIRVRGDQTVVMKGDLLRAINDESGKLYEFHARVGAELDLRQVSVRPLAELPPTHCPKCGGEKDNEGWCARYCMEGE